MAQNLPPGPEVVHLANNAGVNPLEWAITAHLVDIGRALSNAQKTEEEKNAVAEGITAFLDAVVAGEANPQLGFQAPNVGPNFNSDRIEILRDDIRYPILKNDIRTIIFAEEKHNIWFLFLIKEWIHNKIYENISFSVFRTNHYKDFDYILI